MEKKEREIKSFTFNYDDGTSETVEKGFFCKITDTSNGDIVTKFEMIDVRRKDLYGIVMGCVKLGMELGFFDQKPGGTDDV